jgi:hypothetical protein
VVVADSNFRAAQVAAHAHEAPGGIVLESRRRRPCSIAAKPTAAQFVGGEGGALRPPDGRQLMWCKSARCASDAQAVGYAFQKSGKMPFLVAYVAVLRSIALDPSSAAAAERFASGVRTTSQQIANCRVDVEPRVVCRIGIDLGTPIAAARCNGRRVACFVTFSGVRIRATNLVWPRPSGCRARTVWVPSISLLCRITRRRSSAFWQVLIAPSF